MREVGEEEGKGFFDGGISARKNMRMCMEMPKKTGEGAEPQEVASQPHKCPQGPGFDSDLPALPDPTPISLSHSFPVNLYCPTVIKKAKSPQE